MAQFIYHMQMCAKSEGENKLLVNFLFDHSIKIIICYQHKGDYSKHISTTLI